MRIILLTRLLLCIASIELCGYIPKFDVWYNKDGSIGTNFAFKIK